MYTVNMYLLHAELAGGSLTNLITLGIESLCIHYDHVFVTAYCIWSVIFSISNLNTQS